MSNSFHTADKGTHRRVMLVGLMFCAAFVAFSFFAREQPANHLRSAEGGQAGPHRRRAAARELNNPRTSRLTRTTSHDGLQPVALSVPGVVGPTDRAGAPSTAFSPMPLSDSADIVAARPNVQARITDSPGTLIVYGA